MNNKDWPQHEPVGILFTRDMVIVDTGDTTPGIPGTTGLVVKQDQADILLQAMRIKKRINECPLTYEDAYALIKELQSETPPVRT